MDVASCFAKGALEFVSEATWDEWNPGVGSQTDAVVHDVVEDFVSFCAHVSVEGEQCEEIVLL